MTGVWAGPGSHRDARALRFLLLLLGAWTMVRVTAHWSPVPPSAPPEVPAAPWAIEAAPPRWIAAAAAVPPSLPGEIETPAVGGQPGPPRAASLPRPTPPVLSPAPMAVASGAVAATGSWSAASRHQMRLALMARLLPPLPGGGVRGAVPLATTAWTATPLPARTAPPGGGQPFWMQRQLAGWSLGGWVYARGGSGAAPGGIASASQLGGSQAGLRLAFGFGDRGRLRAYGRATIALATPRQRDLAFGLAFAPVAHWPVDVAVEQRFAAGRDGRTALAAFVSGGVGDIILPHRFRLEAYGQAGVVGAKHRDGFADGAAVVDREIARTPQASLHLGALAAGSVQPGAARVDVGPRMTLRLPEVGQGSRVALDWRQRVAGDARPDSGVALTLAADF